MIIATWNINGVVRRLDNLLDWLDRAAPDVVCLQELKCTSSDFPVDAFDAAGYGAICSAEGRWNGVAILARGRQPVPTCVALPGDPVDKQARYIEAAIDGWIVASIYAPNGNPQPGKKFDYKIRWLDRLAVHAADRAAMNAPVVLAGDYNVVGGPADIYETNSYDDNAMTQPEAQAALLRLINTGYVDLGTQTEPLIPSYSFWDYRRNRWERDAGLRIDLILANSLAQYSEPSIAVHRDERGRPNASDHAPVVAHF